MTNPEKKVIAMAARKPDTVFSALNRASSNGGRFATLNSISSTPRILKITEKCKPPP